MDTITQLKTAIQFAKQNPDSSQAIQLRRRIEGGMYRSELEQIKKESNLTYSAPEKRSVAEKILGFTGGEKLGQGLGQALANKGISKDIEAVQKSQIEMQGNLIKKIKEDKALGKDTIKLERALTELNSDIDEIGQGAGKLLNQNELTNKQVIGDALQLGTTLGTIGGVSGAGAKATGTLGKIPGLTKQGTGIITKTADAITKGGVGVLRGGAKGALIGGTTGVTSGALFGAAQGLKEDKDTKGILNSAKKGAIIGGLGGVAVGGVLGSVSGGIKQANLNKQNSYLKAITPDTKDLTPTEYEDLLNKKKITPKTKTSPAKYVLSEGEKNVAKKYSKLFTNDPVKNTENIINEIAKKDDEVGVFLKKNNGIFNSGELKNNLSKKLDGIDDLLVSDEKLSKAKTSIIDNFMKSLKKNDMESLWRARKEFDQQIEKAFTGSPTLQNNMKKAFRNAVQDFIAERTPDEVYKTAMKEMSELFNLRDITNTKAVKEKGLNAIQLWVKRHPTRTKVIGTVAGTGVLTGIGASLLKD